ncbi:hypothetical protein ACF08M_15620 [Streptomyces sp. NPDC015032]|uniref:hypothetical protein n=1 Tax=Streptomyces sp. NPDC015032 TaxID=3364937 RepID=UPI0036FF280C
MTVLLQGRRPRVSFNQPLAPGQADQLRLALRTTAMPGDVEALLRQHLPGGHRHDRAIVANYLLGRGIDTVPRNVLLTTSTYSISCAAPGPSVRSTRFRPCTTPSAGCSTGSSATGWPPSPAHTTA